MSLATVSLATSSLGTIVPRYNVPCNNIPHDNRSLQQLFLATIIPLFLYKWSFTKRTVLRMTKINGTEEHRLLQIIIQMIRPPPFLCKWLFAKRTVLWMTNIFLAENRIRPAPSIEDPQYKISAQMDQRLRS